MDGEMGYMGADFGASASMDVLPVGYGQSPTAAQRAAAPAAAPTPAAAPAAVHGIDVVPAGTPKQVLPPGAPTLGPVAPGNDSHTPFWVGDGSAWPQPSRGVARTPFPEQPAPTAPPEPPVLFAGANFGAGWQPRMLRLKDGTVVQQYPDQSFLVVSTDAKDLAAVRGKRITASTFGQLWGRIYREVGNYVPPVLTAIQSAVAQAQGTFVPAQAAAASAGGGAMVPVPPAEVVPAEAGLPTWAKITLGLAAAGITVVVLRRMFSR